MAKGKIGRLFLGVCWLCVTIVIAGTAFWWIVWPDRVVQQFVENVSAGKIEKANELMQSPSVWSVEVSGRVALKVGEELQTSDLGPKYWQWWLSSERVEFTSRTIGDTLAGRRRFKPVGSKCHFVAARGLISVHVSQPDRLNLEILEGRYNWVIKRITDARIQTGVSASEDAVRLRVLESELSTIEAEFACERRRSQKSP
jgi:hypothetical protein